MPHSAQDQELRRFARKSISNDCAPVLHNNGTLRIGCGNRVMFAAKATLADAHGELRLCDAIAASNASSRSESPYDVRARGPPTLRALELGDQAMNITQNPYLHDLIATESEHCGAHILNWLSGRSDPEDLTTLRSAVRKAGERLVFFGNDFFDFDGEIRKGVLDEVNVFCELRVPIFVLSQRAAESYVLSQQDRNESLIEAIPQLMAKALDQLPVSAPPPIFHRIASFCHP